MPTYDRTHGTTSAPSEADSRLDRPLRLDWSALFGGTLIGWGVMLVLALVAMAVGLAVIDPFVARPAASNAGAAIWGGISAIIASFIGAFAIIRLSGDRRRSESLMHGTVSWSMSMLLAGMIALYVSGVAAFSRTPVNNTADSRNDPAWMRNPANCGWSGNTRASSRCAPTETTMSSCVTITAAAHVLSPSQVPESNREASATASSRAIVSWRRTSLISHRPFGQSADFGASIASITARRSRSGTRRAACSPRRK